MIRRVAQFEPIPNIPPEGISEFHYIALNAIKRNIELLINNVVTHGSVAVNNLPPQKLQQLTAKGEGYTIPVGNDTVNVAKYEDYVKLAQDVQTLMVDVAIIREYLNALITRLRGG